MSFHLWAPTPIKWPAWFNALATYNAELDRGIVHTPEWDAKMATIQAGYDDWARNGYPDTPLPASMIGWP
jgi:hypothetical protein